MWLAVILIIVILSIFMFSDKEEGPGEKDGDTGINNRTKAQAIHTQKNYTSLPPTGRNLSWYDVTSIAFAFGAYTAGIDANGWISLYEDGTATSYIEIPREQLSQSERALPPDLVKFLDKKPASFETEYGNGWVLETMKIETDYNVASRYYLLGRIVKELNSGAEQVGKSIRVEKSQRQGAVEHCSVSFEPAKM